ncbi:uncharacterized protein BO96DRAFT_436021 [Aspergillus niger CBS 101883]|uniref:uncharacterized protein n=1 Tax=Aspergillus lacticoffeatus (strain CBS 101883) TaxID=1450533 RepID=UPI000D7F297B|nr:uncharacterized protein BO96DRAFT_436021 [Aspergillus niger CBS 101883]PYH54391.1 hypothetical protein BO96DRAFT_436021 [Aspergillus niger CBS 101883]
MIDYGSPFYCCSRSSSSLKVLFLLLLLTSYPISAHSLLPPSVQLSDVIDSGSPAPPQPKQAPRGETIPHFPSQKPHPPIHSRTPTAPPSRNCLGGGCRVSPTFFWKADCGSVCYLPNAVLPDPQRRISLIGKSDQGFARA